MMSRAIWYILFSVIIPLSATIAYYRNCNVYQNAIGPNMLYASTKSPEKNNIIFIGNSRILDHLNPQIIGDSTGQLCYNLALDGSSVAYYNMMFRLYLKNHPKPDYLVLTADFVGMDETFQVYNYPDYFPFLDDTTVANNLAPYNVYYTPAKRLERWYEGLRMVNSKPDISKLESMSNIFKGGERGRQVSDPNRGFQPSWNHWEDFPHDTTASNTFMPYHKGAFDLLRGIIEECQRRSIRVVLITTPMYHDYHRKLGNTRQYTDSMGAIAVQYHLPYWNYLDMKALDSTIYYYNVEHLNREGANIFSSAFGSDLRRYMADSSYVPQIEQRAE